MSNLTTPAPAAGTPVLPPLRWGVLGTASIATRQMIPALAATAGAALAAVASRSRDRAEAVATRFGFSRVHGSYQDLLDDDAVDAVYIPLPNHLHVPWSIKALAAGKHVLCEKPIALNATDLKPLLAAAAARPDLRVMEAFMYRCQPRWRALERLVRDGEIGELGAVSTVFSYFNVDPGNVRNQAAIGGGALLDIGCYGVSVSRLLFGAEPAKVSAAIHRDARFGTDRLTGVLLEFPTGAATVVCSTQLAGFQRVTIFGTEGWIEVNQPFNPPADQPTLLVVHRRDGVEERAFAPCNQYVAQSELFARAVGGGAVPIPLADSVANVRVLDAVQQSVRFGEAIPNV